MSVGDAEEYYFENVKILKSPDYREQLYTSEETILLFLSVVYINSITYGDIRISSVNAKPT